MLKKLTPSRGLQAIKGESAMAALLREMAERERLLGSIKPLLPSELRERCSQASMDGDCLLLFADSPVWAAKIRLFAEKIPAILSERGFAFKHCQVRVSPPLVAVNGLANLSANPSGIAAKAEAGEDDSVAPQSIKPGHKPGSTLSAATAAHLKQAARSIPDARIAACFERIARHHAPPGQPSAF